MDTTLSLGITTCGWICISIALFLGLAFYGAPFWLWTAAAALALWGFEASQTAWIVFAVIAVVFNVPPIRMLAFSGIAMKVMKALKLMPTISPTEAIALKAGDVWIEKELFSGKPSFKTLMAEPYPELTAEEKAFIDGPVEKLCEMVDDFAIWKSRVIPPAVMDFIKKEKFFGMIIPKEYGGLGFSALMNSEVIHKLSARSMPVAVTVMVPNSLGPAELLVHYGTDEQKKRLLPRLAIGQEVPCFALTEPSAGSDAASIQAGGTVFKKDGKLFMRLNWDKRWITLASEATLIGLAFRLFDPENLLGKGADLGITCALIPSNTPGVTADKRHDPLYVPFVNSPTQGKDVEVPLDVIIGGAEGAGRGWEMLMESLGAGRGISLPAQSTGGSKMAARVVSAHATVRKQFGMSTGRFEGVAEAIGRIGGYTYMMEAARRYTVGALDSGKKPATVTAIMKHYTTEIGRKIINDAMDVVAGAAIVVGPRNLLAHAYIAAPIAITVEGANILTRTLMIFGQGAIRSHPYAQLEMEALASNDLKKFDRAFCGHLGHVLRNFVRWNLLSLTRGWLAAPGFGPMAKYRRKLEWVSATFAFLADFYMGSLGGKLKAKGKITGRMADTFGYMYLATAVLRRYEAEGRLKEDEPFVRWALDTAFNEIQKALDGLFASTEAPIFKQVFAWPVRWLHALNPVGRPPEDATELEVARLLQTPGEQRERITGRIFVSKKAGDRLYDLERAFELVVKTEESDRRIKRAVRRKQLTKKPAKELLKDALTAKVISQQEYDDLARVEEIRNLVIQVDSFSQDEYVART
jgi:acyl-CoA dehydrogenase